MSKATAFVPVAVRKRQVTTEGPDTDRCPLFGDIENLYDPAKPHDYEAVIEERERKRREAELEAEKQEHLLRRQTEERPDKDKREKRPIPDDFDNNRRQRQRHDAPPKTADAPPDPPKTGEGKGMNLAQKMLEKFGWREGEGLGKERQGMAAPLMAQKTNKRSAVIVKSQAKQKQTPVATPPSTTSTAQEPVKGTPTKILLLRNLVGPGEVDDDLEDEVASELQKYGTIRRVLIFEVTEDNFPAEEAVRIFIEFQSIDEAQQAAVALNGRFFGGRNVRAGYYDETKFAACDLAPIAGSFG